MLISTITMHRGEHCYYDLKFKYRDRDDEKKTGSDFPLIYECR